MLSTVASLVALLAAAPPPPELPVFSEEVVSVQLVLVPVVVRRSDGFVADLRQRDFSLFVDDRPVPIETFDHGKDAPMRLVLLQDLSGSMANRGRIDASREVARFFLERTHEGDRMAIATFADDQLRVEVPFTDDREALAESMESWEPFGVTALHDAVARLPEMTSGAGHEPRAAILLTDGADNASEVEPAEARDLVRRAELPVYVFSLDPGTPRGSDTSRRYEGILRSLALASGGRYYEIDSPEDWKEAALDVYRALRTRYLLGFAPGGVGKTTYRKIRVEVGKTAKGVTARHGYQGTAPASWKQGD